MMMMIMNLQSFESDEQAAKLNTKTLAAGSIIKGKYTP